MILPTSTYEHDQLTIDLINGGDLLRLWVDDDNALPADLDAAALKDERHWMQTRAGVLAYPD